MTDLTKITTPFGLLDAETQEALKAHGGPYEFYQMMGSWRGEDSPAFAAIIVYRVKPAPPKPREWWITERIFHNTEAEAEQWVKRHPEDGPVIHAREVLP